jgi:hypothetical protein
MDYDNFCKLLKKLPRKEGISILIFLFQQNWTKNKEMGVKKQNPHQFWTIIRIKTVYNIVS